MGTCLCLCVYETHLKRVVSYVKIHMTLRSRVYTRIEFGEQPIDVAVKPNFVLVLMLCLCSRLLFT